MRRAAMLGVLVGLAGCGSLLESWDAGPDASTGLVCREANPCDCPKCTSSSECALGIPCNPAKEKGVACPDGRSVCTADN